MSCCMHVTRNLKPTSSSRNETFPTDFQGVFASYRAVQKHENSAAVFRHEYETQVSGNRESAPSPYLLNKETGPCISELLKKASAPWVGTLHRIKHATSAHLTKDICNGSWTGTPFLSRSIAVILSEHRCNTSRDFNVRSSHFLQIFVLLTSPAFCLIYLSSTSYRTMRRGPRLTPSSINNIYK
jgi:hypothetical protein